MKKYEMPKIEVIKISCEDIIKTSGENQLKYGSTTHKGVDLGSKTMTSILSNTN